MHDKLLNFRPQYCIANIVARSKRPLMIRSMSSGSIRMQVSSDDSSRIPSSNNIGKILAIPLVKLHLAFSLRPVFGSVNHPKTSLPKLYV